MYRRDPIKSGIRVWASAWITYACSYGWGSPAAMERKMRFCTKKTKTHTHAQDAHHATQTKSNALDKLVVLTRGTGGEVGKTQREVWEEKWGSVGKKVSL